MATTYIYVDNYEETAYKKHTSISVPAIVF
jgi:hypothetical protein